VGGHPPGPAGVRNWDYRFCYGGSELDAAVLLIGEVGFLPADDPRFVSTVHVLASDLVQEGFLRRYSGAGQVRYGDASADLAYCAQTLTAAFPDARLIQRTSPS
jgi:GH15 family glucan-1,4-alpha-glucosidase